MAALLSAAVIAVSLPPYALVVFAVFVLSRADRDVIHLLRAISRRAIIGSLVLTLSGWCNVTLCAHLCLLHNNSQRPPTAVNGEASHSALAGAGLFYCTPFIDGRCSHHSQRRRSAPLSSRRRPTAHWSLELDRLCAIP